MKISHLILVVLILMCVLLGYAFSIPEIPKASGVIPETARATPEPPGATPENAGVVPKPPGAHGSVHPIYETMLIGQAGELQNPNIMVIGLLYGLTQILIYVLLFFLTMQPKQKSMFRNVLLILSGSLFAAVFTMMVDAHLTSITQQPVILSGPFPTATSWMLFGISTAPLAFVAIYVFGFDRWIWSDKNQSDFEAILAQHQQPPSDKE